MLQDRQGAGELLEEVPCPEHTCRTQKDNICIYGFTKVEGLRSVLVWVLEYFVPSSSGGNLHIFGKVGGRKSYQSFIFQSC